MPISRTPRFLAAASLLALCTPVLAQETAQMPPPAPSANTAADDYDMEIIVSVDGLRTLDVLSAQSVVEDAELLRNMSGQIGDVLARQPGVSATSFAPGASRPVLRGFTGSRVAVLTDGLGALDLSANSADHGVAIDPLTAERIEVLRGPAVLLYGSQAIGGAVNVVDRRIPRRMPTGGFDLQATGTLGSNADERRGGAAADLALSERIVLHVDGSYGETDDFEAGGYVLSSRLRAEQSAIAAEERAEGHLDEAEEALALANRRGRVPDSASRQYTLGGGLSVITDTGSLGFSVGLFDSRYGVPERPGAEHAHGEEEDGHDEAHDEDHGDEHGHGEDGVSIDLRQWRGDVRAEVDTGGGVLDRIRVRAGYADYEHTEFEGAEVGTRFFSQAFEGRLDLVQAQRGRWSGVTGAQAYTRDFDAIGAEAFVPASRSDQFGIFTLQEFDFAPWELDLAGRYERSSVSSNPVVTALESDATMAVDRNFDAVSGAATISRRLSPGLRAGITGSRAERAPSSEELFSNGAHIATQSYELGNPDFGTESAWGLEGWIDGDLGPAHVHFAAYGQWFDDFIYASDTGREIDGLPLFAYTQGDARWLGLEGQIAAPFVVRDGFTLSGDLVFDYIDAQLADGTPLPRIPPLRILPGIEAQAGPFSMRAEVEHAFAQDDVAGFETPTEDYTLVNLSAGWQPFGADNDTQLIVSANNLFDVTARRHASLTKDFVPMPGRDIRVAIRFSI
ncbi:TonB-dependent receptor [uncultured Croceicoccus sp.]|uniref:TonB-dependent receptor n=1 Tax=uncultured Croceicoccus sp. TaxID=1295329 RepID=UPI00261684F1|nr:TonB-dependent receptor [uncultured Croceicoccus sp.]